MSDKMKAALGAVALSLIALLYVYISELGVQPLPLPSPSPSLSASPVITTTSITTTTVAPTTTLPAPSGIVLKGVLGETVSTIYVADKSQQVPVGLKAFEIIKVETSIPSYKDAPIGFHEDPLKPVTAFEIGKRYWLEVKLSTVGTQVYGFVTTITKNVQMKTMPFYMELQSRQTLLAHKLADSVVNECPIRNKYTALLREHGVEPIKQFVLTAPQIVNGKLDLDGYFPAYGCDFRTSVLKGSIAPPMIFSWNPSASDALISATKASLADLPADSWAYNWDEGEPALDAQSLAQAKRYKLSGLKLLQTHKYADSFAPYIDWFCPVVNFAPFAGSPACAYTSCMANGNCANQASAATVAPATGHPMMTLDAPSIHARIFPLVVTKLGSRIGLYFNSTQRLPTAWNKDGQYNEGGQGDGTVLYPGTDGNPWPSLRLKRLHRGLQDAFYLQGSMNPVTSATVWPKDEAQIEAARLSAWDKL